MNLETLSSFALARLLNDAAEGSAFQRAIQKELRRRWQIGDRRLGSIFHLPSSISHL